MEANPHAGGLCQDCAAGHGEIGFSRFFSFFSRFFVLVAAELPYKNRVERHSTVAELNRSFSINRSFFYRDDHFPIRNPLGN